MRHCCGAAGVDFAFGLKLPLFALRGVACLVPPNPVAGLQEGRPLSSAAPRVFRRRISCLLGPDHCLLLLFISTPSATGVTVSLFFVSLFT